MIRRLLLCLLFVVLAVAAQAGRVLIVTQDEGSLPVLPPGGDGLYVASDLVAAGIPFDLMPISRFVAADLSKYDIVIIDGVPNPTPISIIKGVCKKFIADGGKLFVNGSAVFVFHDTTGKAVQDSEFLSSIWPVTYMGYQTVQGSMDVPGWIERDAAITQLGLPRLNMRSYVVTTAPSFSITCNGNLIGFVYPNGGFIDHNQLSASILNYGRLVYFLRYGGMRACGIANDVMNGKRIASIELHGDMSGDAIPPPLISALADRLKIPITCLLVNNKLSSASTVAWQNASLSPNILIGSHSLSHPMVWNVVPDVILETKGSLDRLRVLFPTMTDYMDFSGDMSPTADQLRLINAAGVNHGAYGGQIVVINDVNGNHVYTQFMPEIDNWYRMAVDNIDIPNYFSFTALNDWSCSLRGWSFTDTLMAADATNRKLGLYTYTFIHDYSFSPNWQQPNWPTTSDDIAGVVYLATQTDTACIPTPQLVTRLSLFNQSNLTVNKIDNDHWDVTFDRPLGNLNTLKFDADDGVLPEVTGSSVRSATEIAGRLYVDLVPESTSQIQVNWDPVAPAAGKIMVDCHSQPVGVPMSVELTGMNALGQATKVSMTVPNGSKVAIPLSSQDLTSVLVSVPNHLSRRFDALSLNPSLQLNIDMLAGDMNNDGQINLFDFVELDSKFGHTIDPMDDPDGDGVVTLFDYVVLDQEFGAKADASDTVVSPPDIPLSPVAKKTNR